MTSLDVHALLHALDNEKNENILETTTANIQTKKNNMLQKLQLPREKLKSMHKSLKLYKYIDEIPDIQLGRYIRWISLKNPENITLSRGGIICNILIGNDDVEIKCKNNRNRFFSIKFNECLVFQKLTEQELVILSAVNHLAT